VWKNNAPYLRFLLQQHLVVLAERRAEDDRGNALEAVYPLLALGALPSNIEHVYSIKELINDNEKRHERGTYESSPIENRVSVMPTLFCRARSTSVSLGRYPGVPIRSTSAKKLKE